MLPSLACKPKEWIWLSVFCLMPFAKYRMIYLKYFLLPLPKFLWGAFGTQWFEYSEITFQHQIYIVCINPVTSFMEIPESI